MSPSTKLIAFLIEGPAGGIPGFQQSVLITASQSELEEKIRQETHCPDAAVKIVVPSEWNPPALAEVSDQEIYNKAQTIFDCIMRYLINNAVQVDRSDLENGGTEIRNPVSGKVFFVFKHY